MAFIDGIQRFEHTLVERMRSSFEESRRQYRMRQAFRRTVDEMNALSERELDDLGLARGDIADVARKAVYNG